MTSSNQNPIHTIAVVAGEGGDVGKSTLVRHAIRPALAKLCGSCEYLLIERKEITTSEGETELFGPEDTPAVLTRCAKARAKKQAVVVEVGAGQSAAFVSRIEEYKGSEGRIDLWVLPIQAHQKAAKIIETINKFIALGVQPEKLAVVVNFVPAGRKACDVIKKDMPALAEHAASYGYRILQNGIPSSQTLRDLRTLTDYTVGSIARSDVDYAAQAEALWAADKDDEAEQLSKVALLSMGAAGVIDYVDAMVDELLGTAPVLEIVLAA